MAESPFFSGKNLTGQEQWARRGEAQAAVAAAPGSLPVGVPVPWPAATAPAGWLICDGSAVPAGCPALSALYGANLPNLKGVTIVGYDAAQAEFNTLLGSSGAKTVTLTSAQMPSHGHTQNSHTHTADDTLEGAQNTGSTEPPNHQHQTGTEVATGVTQIYYDLPGAAPTFFVPGGAARWISTRATNGGTIEHTHGLTAGVAAGIAHTHSVAAHEHDISVSTDTATNQSAGGGGAHSNLQPYRVFNYIVEAA